MADILTLKKFEALSPFEIKDELINLAKATSRQTQTAFLNAGRGNPNWVATTPREGFFLLGQFAITESKRVMDLPAGVGGMAQASGRKWPIAAKRCVIGKSVARVAAHDPKPPFEASSRERRVLITKRSSAHRQSQASHRPFWSLSYP